MRFGSLKNDYRFIYLNRHLPEWRFFLLLTMIVIVKRPTWNVIRISSHLLSEGGLAKTACRSAVLSVLSDFSIVLA